MENAIRNPPMAQWQTGVLPAAPARERRQECPCRPALEPRKIAASWGLMASPRCRLRSKTPANGWRKTALLKSGKSSNSHPGVSIGARFRQPPEPNEPVPQHWQLAHAV